MFKRIQKHVQAYQEAQPVSDSDKQQLSPQGQLEQDVQGRCNLCDVVLRTYAEGEQHLESVRHRVKLKAFKIVYNKRIQTHNRKGITNRRNLMQRYRLMRDLYKLSLH